MVRSVQMAGAPIAPVGTPAPHAAASDLRTAGLLMILAAGAAGFWLLPLGIEPLAHKALAVGLFMIAAWIAMELVGAFDVGKGSNIARGMFIILVYQATIFDKMVIAGASSITARGAIEKFGEVPVLWSQWALAYLPCDIIVMIVAWRLALWMYPPETATLPGGSEYLQREIRAMGPWSRDEVRAALLMSLAIGLWVTDFLHHIPAPMIGLGVGLLAVMPRVGVLDTEDLRKINYLPIFFVAAAVSLR